MLGVGLPSAQATLLRSDTQQFAVLGQFSNNQTNFNNGTITGDIGIGAPRALTFSNCSLVGNARFSGAANVSGLSGGPIPGPGPFTVTGGGTVSGSVVANDPAVASALNYSNDLGMFLGGQAGTALNIATGGSINVAAGTLATGLFLDGNPLGNFNVFTVGSVNFPNGIFTINGSATDQVVLNVSSNANFHGSIVLAGGITSDHVVINMFGGNYTSHTAGPTLDVNTNGAVTTATWLDPNGGMSAVHTDIRGRFFGGDVQNQQIVSGADITMPPVPAPSAVALLALGALGVHRRRRRMN
jgi:MYXO-CTERM domain-containing protein